MQTFLTMLGIALISIMLAASLFGCAGGPARYHADRNMEYARNCGDAMDQLGLCGGRYLP